VGATWLRAAYAFNAEREATGDFSPISPLAIASLYSELALDHGVLWRLRVYVHPDLTSSGKARIVQGDLARPAFLDDTNAKSRV
jgi:hypothetical protein